MSKSSSKSTSPRAMPVDTIVTRYKSAQQKMLRESNRPTRTSSSKSPKRIPRQENPRGRKKKNREPSAERTECIEEFYPLKQKRPIVAKKIELKPKHEMKFIGQANKRKRRVPRKELQESNWPSRTQSPVSRGSSPKPKKRKTLNKNLGREEMLKLIEDSGSLDDEDLLEILTCPSPVWWEDPPDGYIEEALFCRSRSTAEVYPSVRSQLLQDTVNKKRPSTPNILLRKRKVTKKSTPKDNKLDDSETSAVNVELSLAKCDEKFIKKRSKLESVLGNLRNKNLNIPKDTKIDRGKSVIERNEVCHNVCAGDIKESDVDVVTVQNETDFVDQGNKSGYQTAMSVIRSTIREKHPEVYDNESNTGDQDYIIGDNSEFGGDNYSVDVGPCLEPVHPPSNILLGILSDNVPSRKPSHYMSPRHEAAKVADHEVCIIDKVIEHVDLTVKYKDKDVARKRIGSISESTDDEQLTDLGLQDEDILSNLENMDIPVENKQSNNDNGFKSNVVNKEKTEFCIRPPKKLTRYRNVNLVDEVTPVANFASQPIDNVSVLKNNPSINESAKASQSVEPPNFFSTARSASPHRTYTEPVICIPNESIVYDTNRSASKSSPMEDYYQMELFANDNTVIDNPIYSNNHDINVNTLLKCAETHTEYMLKEMVREPDYALPAIPHKTTVPDPVDYVNVASNLDNLDSISDTNICFLNDDDHESGVEKKSDATNSSDYYNADDNYPICNVPQNYETIDYSINNNNVATPINEPGPKQIHNRTESILRPSKECKINCIKLKDRFKYRFLLSTLDDEVQTKAINLVKVGNKESVNAKSNYAMNRAENLVSRRIDEPSNNIYNEQVNPVMLDTMNNVIKHGNATDKSDNGQMNFYFKKCKNVYRRTNKSSQMSVLNPATGVFDTVKEHETVIRESVINLTNKMVDTNENITHDTVDNKLNDHEYNMKKSIVVSDSKQVKYCLTCSSIFDTAECVYCYNKNIENDLSDQNIYQYYRCDKCDYKSVRKSRFLRHLSDCGKC